MADERDTRTPAEAQELVEETETLTDTEEVAESEVAEDLGSTATKGPALDQDEGPIQTPGSDRGSRKERVGLVVSDKPDKTVTVAVETLVRHPKYKKRVRSSKKFLVHDERNDAQAGDTVRIVETRPLSARKRWRLGNIISRAE